MENYKHRVHFFLFILPILCLLKVREFLSWSRFHVGRLGPAQTEQKEKWDGINTINYYFPVLVILYKVEIVFYCPLFYMITAIFFSVFIHFEQLPIFSTLKQQNNAPWSLRGFSGTWEDFSYPLQDLQEQLSWFSFCHSPSAVCEVVQAPSGGPRPPARRETASAIGR